MRVQGGISVVPRAPQIWLEKALAVAIAIFALLAVWNRWPYGTYTILRFALCAMSVYLAVRSYGVGQRAWVWIGGITAALFNPFFPVHLQRSQWRILDFGAALVLALWAWKVRPPVSEQQLPSPPSPPPQTTDLGPANKMLAVQDVASPSRKTRVLVCDDEPAIADFIAKALKGDDCETVVEYSGLDAVYRAATFRPEIALLGFVMPKMDGVEAGMNLLKISPKTKIVLITEQVPPEALETLKGNGYNFDAFPAPFTVEDLRAMIFVWSCE
jgi:CheY-like chemotaxis protein